MRPTKSVNIELYNGLAEDALSILRIDFVLIGLYLTTFGLLSQSNNSEFLMDVLEASYTQFSFHAIFASMVASALVYRKCRRISVQGEVPRKDKYSEEMMTLNIVAASAFASVGSVVCMALGVLEAFAGGTPPISFPIVALTIFVVLWIFTPFVVLYFADKLSERYRYAQDLFQMFI